MEMESVDYLNVINWCQKLYLVVPRPYLTRLFIFIYEVSVFDRYINREKKSVSLYLIVLPGCSSRVVSVVSALH